MTIIWTCLKLIISIFHRQSRLNRANDTIFPELPKETFSHFPFACQAGGSFPAHRHLWRAKNALSRVTHFPFFPESNNGKLPAHFPSSCRKKWAATGPLLPLHFPVATMIFTGDPFRYSLPRITKIWSVVTIKWFDERVLCTIWDCLKVYGAVCLEKLQSHKLENFTLSWLKAGLKFAQQITLYNWAHKYARLLVRSWSKF